MIFFLFTSRKAGQHVLGGRGLLAFLKPQFMCNLFETFEPQDFSKKKIQKIQKIPVSQTGLPGWITRPVWLAGPVLRES